MRKIIAGILSLFAGQVWAAQSVPFPDVEMKLIQISAYVYYVQGLPGVATENAGFISNAAAVLTTEGWVIVDTLGTPSLGEMLLQRLQKISSKPIKKVFITHYHADHIYGMQVFKALGAETYAPVEVDNYLASEIAEKRLEERRESLKPWVNAETRLLRPDHYVDKDFTFKLGDTEFAVMHFGSAHSEGDLSVYVKNEKVLLTGDLVFNGRIPFVGGDDIAHWIAKLEEIARVPADVVVPGHGKAFKDVADGTGFTKDYLQLMYTKMLAAVNDMMPFDEAYGAVDWSKYKGLPAFDAGNRRNALRVFTALEAGSFAKK
ncbi:MAG: MBL fold metallo-hydrolase [Pseudomonadota bacterium]